MHIFQPAPTIVGYSFASHLNLPIRDVEREPNMKEILVSTRPATAAGCAWGKTIKFRLELVMDFRSIGIPELIGIAFIATLSGATGWVLKGAKTVFDLAVLIFKWPFSLFAFSMGPQNSLN
jgi:hypothetical protein